MLRPDSDRLGVRFCRSKPAASANRVFFGKLRDLSLRIVPNPEPDGDIEDDAGV